MWNYDASFSIFILHGLDEHKNRSRVLKTKDRKIKRQRRKDGETERQTDVNFQLKATREKMKKYVLTRYMKIFVEIPVSHMLTKHTTWGKQSVMTHCRQERRLKNLKGIGKCSMWRKVACMVHVILILRKMIKIWSEQRFWRSYENEEQYSDSKMSPQCNLSFETIYVKKNYGWDVTCRRETVLITSSKGSVLRRCKIRTRNLTISSMTPASSQKRHYDEKIQSFRWWSDHVRRLLEWQWMILFWWRHHQKIIQLQCIRISFFKTEGYKSVISS